MTVIFKLSLIAVFLISAYCQDTFSCYDCNSGHMGWRHKDCPTNGVINRDKITTVKCDERCFTRTNKWTEGVIHRGCSSNFYLPRPGLPENGCVQDPLKNWWCFCMGDECNTDDMSTYV